MYLSEIFSSIQGEGIYLGYKQIFIRTTGCNISCDYCDENIEEGRDWKLEEIIAKVNELNKTWHHSISLTGGEPLLQVNDLLKIIPDLPLPVMLETNATLPAHLKELIGKVDIFSMDYKPGYETEFSECLKLVKNEDVYVKYVLMPDTKIFEIREFGRLMKNISKDIPLILQPVTPCGKIKFFPTEEQIINAYNILKKDLNDVRVIPQTHKIMGVH
ncbi:MAG: 7-carboxy-7-deazaguanine synthase QueE [Candidatus Margulisbacteria bacterium]|nr:7-carboxy-7-deazaguanine synthase QueE [Candidatus Margulisiibacteriota bacterium]